MPRTTLFLAALLAVLALAQEPAIIHGVVHDDEGNPVAGANVRLVLRDNLIAETQTNPVGTFRFDAPASAGYSLHAVKPGLCIESVALENFANDLTNIILKAPPGPVPPLIRVSSAVQHARLLHVVQPEYPANAEAHGIGGTVYLNLLIDEYGSPIEVHASGRSSPFFTQSAINAVRQWRYRSTALNCVPVKVETQASFAFDADARAVSLRGEL